MTELYAGVFENDDTNAEIIEQFTSVEGAGVDWNIDQFGITRIEATVKANGPYDAYARYLDVNKGYRFALYDSTLSQPISGWIYEAKWLSGDRIKYIAYGTKQRMEDSYIVRRFDSTDTLTTAITYITGRILPASSNTDNIATNATTLDGWNPAYPQGSYPTQAIPQILDMSDSAYRIYDYRLIDEPMKQTSLGQFTPHYAYRDSTASADWVVNRKDLAANGLRLSRNINNFATIVRVWYGLIEGTSTGVTTNTMTDSGAAFLDDGVAPGDMITNLTKGGRTRVVTVDSQTQITHEGWRAKLRGTATGGSTTTLLDTENGDFINDGVQIGDIVYNVLDDSTGTVTVVGVTQLTHTTMTGAKTNEEGERYEVTGAMVSGDDYSIETKAEVKYQEYKLDRGNLWDKEIAVFESSMNEAQAAQYAQQLATITPQQEQSFIISAKFIKDGNGSRRPLWDMIAYGGGYIQIPDLYPAAATFTDSLNSLTTFWITGMSYDDKSNKMTVNVDNPSRRLDARLVRAKILQVAQVTRY